jgi:hypothetical protein
MMKEESMMKLSNSVGILGDPPAGAAVSRLDKTPIVGGLLLGLMASLSCGGIMFFAAIGLGAFYGSLQLSHYIPQALASGAILITLLNWLYYRRKATRMLAANGSYDSGNLRRTVLLSGLIGLLKMSVSFVFLEWLNHGVVYAAHFMNNPEYAGAMIPGVPNSHLGYLALTFLSLPVLAILPLPQKDQGGTSA